MSTKTSQSSTFDEIEFSEQDAWLALEICGVDPIQRPLAIAGRSYVDAHFGKCRMRPEANFKGVIEKEGRGWRNLADYVKKSLGIPYKDALDRLGKGNRSGVKRTRSMPPTYKKDAIVAALSKPITPVRFDVCGVASERHLKEFCEWNPPLSPADIRAFNALVGNYSQFQGKYSQAVFSIPAYDPSSLHLCNHEIFSLVNADGIQQRTKDDRGEWKSERVKVLASEKNNIDGIIASRETLELLRAGEAIENAIVVKAEGPKDCVVADSIARASGQTVLAFTNLFGARSPHAIKAMMEQLAKIKPSKFIVVHDRDTAGQEGAKQWCHAAAEICTDVVNVLLPFPMAEKKGADLRDWAKESPRTWEDFIGLPTEQVTAAETGSLSEQPVGTESENSEQINIANFDWELVTDNAGEKKRVQVARTLRMSIDAILTRYEGFPKACSGMLFIKNTDGSISYLKNPASLFAWLRMNDSSVQWGSGPDLATKEELFAGLLRSAESFIEIQKRPHFPGPIPGMYYACETPTAGSGGRLSEFLDYFNPHDPLDRELILAALVTPAWNGPAGQRPAFAVTSEHGQGAGKTTLVSKIADIYGGLFEFSARGDFEKERTRLLSGEAIGKRIVLIDNIKATVFSSSNLESMVTTSELSGHRMYVGESTRPNLFTYFLTMNGVSLSRDMAQRCVTICLGEAIRRGDWVSSIDRFITDHRNELFADICGFFERPQKPFDGFNRWGTWQREVLSRLDRPQEIAELLKKREDGNDADRDIANELEGWMFNYIAKQGFGEAYSVHVPSRFLSCVLSELNGEKTSPKAATQLVSRLVDARLLLTVEKNPSHQCGRGFIWSDAKGSVERDLDPSKKIIYANEKFLPWR